MQRRRRGGPQIPRLGAADPKLISTPPDRPCKHRHRWPEPAELELIEYSIRRCLEVLHAVDNAAQGGHWSTRQQFELLKAARRRDVKHAGK